MSELKDPHQSGPTTDRSVQVDIDGLASFRTFLNRELDQNLAPSADKVIREHDRGYGFGWKTRSQQVVATQGFYLQGLMAAMNNMSMYVRYAQVLVKAIEDVMERYRDSDLSASDLSLAIQNRLAAAATAADVAAHTPDPYRAAL